MRFEHLVQINDPLNPLLDTLTRAQLWRGLVLRAESPQQFVFGLAGCRIHSREQLASSMRLTRTLDFGAFEVHDRVELEPEWRTHTTTEAGATWPAGRLDIFIEEPQPENLYLRFVYELEGPEDSDSGEFGAQVEALRREAYRGADLDTVARIRQLAEAGTLG